MLPSWSAPPAASRPSASQKALSTSVASTSTRRSSDGCWTTLPGDSGDLDLTNPAESGRPCSPASGLHRSERDTIHRCRHRHRCHRRPASDDRPTHQGGIRGHDSAGPTGHCRCTTRALRSANISPAELTTFVLVGGSSRIPLVTETLTSSVPPSGRPQHPPETRHRPRCHPHPADPDRQQQRPLAPVLPVALSTARHVAQPSVVPLTQPWASPTPPPDAPSVAPPPSPADTVAAQLPTEIIDTDAASRSEATANRRRHRPAVWVDTFGADFAGRCSVVPVRATARSGSIFGDSAAS